MFPAGAGAAGVDGAAAGAGVEGMAVELEVEAAGTGLACV